MTLNKVINRIKLIATSHNQIRHFSYSAPSDFVNDKKVEYMAAFLESTGGTISTSGSATTINYRLTLYDLQNVSEDTNTNLQDVESDTVSVMMDLLTQMNDGNFYDWKVSKDNSIQLLEEKEGDMVAGCYMDFSISIIFSQNQCRIPSDLMTQILNDEDMKLVYDVEYVATGDEGKMITTGGDNPNLPIVNGKKIILIIREGNPLHKKLVPDSAEYSWDNTDITLGTITQPNERFLILYRNY